MRMVNGILLGVLVGLPLIGRAADKPVTNTTWKSSVALGLTYKSGNTDKNLYTLDFKGNRYAPKSDWINSLHGEYGTTDGAQTEGQLREQSDYRYKFSGKRWYGGVFGEAYHDAIKDIYARLRGGPNLGYYFITTDAMKLDSSVGINEVYERSASGNDDYAEWRVAGNFLWTVSKTASVYANAEYSARISDYEDATGLLVVGAKSKINSKLAMFIEMRDEYDNKPEPGTQSLDTTVTAGLNYDLL